MGPGSDCKVYGMLQRELVLITLVIGGTIWGVLGYS